MNAQNSAIKKKIVFNGTLGTPNATDGIEQSVYDPTKGVFYLSIPEINGKTPGGISQINPLTGAVIKTFDLGAFGVPACSPAGLARGSSGALMVGCNKPGTQAVLFDPNANGGNGAVLEKYGQVNGSDEVWFDPATDRFFVTGGNNSAGPVVGVIDGATLALLQNIPTVPGNAHSVAVDPVSGEVFVPFPGLTGNDVCPSGCIAVYAAPEPGSLPLMLVAIFGIAGIGLSTARRAVH